MIKKATAQVDADEKSKKVPSSEGSVFRPGDRVIKTLGSKTSRTTVSAPPGPFRAFKDMWRFVDC